MHRMTLNRACRIYCRQVWKKLPCSHRERKEIVSALRETAAHSGITEVEKLYEHFGTPDDLARAYLEDSSPVQETPIWQTVLKVLLITILTLCLIRSVTFGIMNLMNTLRTPTYIENPSVTLPKGETK